MEQSKDREKSISNCPYGKCDGSGLIITNNDWGGICQCQKDKAFNKKLAFANIPEEFRDLTINSFDTNLYSTQEFVNKATIAKKAAVNFIINFNDFKEQGKGLYFYNYIKGSGKTRLAASIGNALMKQYRADVRYTTTPDLIMEIKKTFHKDSDTTESDLIDSIRKVDVLILDDVGVEDPTPWVKTTFYSILNGRMISKKVTIFTSNSTIDDLKHDDRIRNRIERMAVPIEFPNESIRSKLAKEENEELQKLLLK